MRKWIAALTCAFALFAFVGTASAQDDGGGAAEEVDRKDKSGYENMIIVGPWFLPPGFSVRYDRMLSDNLSLILGAGYGSISSGDSTFNRVQVLLGADFLPFKNGFAGLYVGPRIRINNYGIKAESDGESADGSVLAIGAGAIVGYRWVWHPGFSLGLGLGAQYFTVASEAEAEYDDGTEASTGSFSYDGFFPALEFTLGWAF